MISQESSQTTNLKIENRYVRFFLRYLRPNKHWLYTLLPLGLIVLALVFINWGLHTQIGADEPFDTFELPYIQPFDEVAINRWFTSGGKWTLDNSTLIQTDESAEVTKIFVPHWLVEGEPYHLAVEVTLSASTQAAGINFNAQYPDIHHNHHRVYLTRDGSKTELIAGTVSEKDGFEAQVTTTVPSTEDKLRLDLLVHETSYDVHVNGQPLIENRPLSYYDGLVGLFSIDGPTTFDNLQLDVIDETFRADLAEVEQPAGDVDYPDVGRMLYTSNFNSSSGDAGWVPFSGDWQVENGYLSQLDPNGYDFGIGYEGRPFDSFLYQVSLQHLTGSGGGILFNMESPYQVHGAHMVRYSDRSDAIYWGYFDETGTFNGQGHANVSPPANESHTFKIMSDAFNYSIYLDTQLIASEIPLYRSDGYIGLIASQSTVSYSLVDISTLLGSQNAENISVENTNGINEVILTDTAVIAQPATVNTTTVIETQPIVEEVTIETPVVMQSDIPNWVPFSGQWIVEDDTLQQIEKDGYDLGIGYGEAIASPYKVEASLRHVEGVGGGILFNMPAPNQFWGAHIIRYADWADALVWGYFDEDGVFTSQGHMSGVNPSGERHTFRIESGSDSYTIYLNDQPIASNIPLLRTDGYIGLTTSQSTAVFDSIKITRGSDVTSYFSPSGTTTATTTVNATPQTDNNFFGDIQFISGDWVTEGDTITQNNPATYDFSISAGVYAGTYTLETEITLPDDPELQDAGGGILFHMPERSNRQGAHMVRLTGRNSLLWGYYDESGTFVGQGRSDLTQTGNVTHTLKIIVQNDTYNIEVDGEVVSLNVQLKQEEGWIGLVSYRGSVVFNNVNIAFAMEE